MPPEASLRDLLQLRERQLLSALEEVRAQFGHSGDKGAGVERAVREFLRLHLPRRYDIGEGEVIDSTGHRSGQTDVVITDDQHPFSFSEGGPSLFLVEGVVAAAEVKSVLTTTELADVVSKGDAFKALQKWSSVGDMAFGAQDPAQDRFFIHPPFFALALDSEVATTTLIDRLAEADRQRGQLPIGLDALFILGRGVAMNLGDGTDNLKVQLADGSSATGWVWNDSHIVLGDLLLWLAATTRRTIRFTTPIGPYLEQYLRDRTFYLPSQT